MMLPRETAPLFMYDSDLLLCGFSMMKMHPSLFPVLLLLSKLYPSSMEGADTALNLKCFVPFVLR